MTINAETAEYAEIINDMAAAPTQDNVFFMVKPLRRSDRSAAT